jgi:hypothetical protein
MNGVDLHAEVLRIDAEQARRIVFITSVPVPGLPNACILKPFNLGELRAAATSFPPVRLAPRRPAP